MNFFYFLLYLLLSVFLSFLLSILFSYMKTRLTLHTRFLKVGAFSIVLVHLIRISTIELEMVSSPTMISVKRRRAQLSFPNGLCARLPPDASIYHESFLRRRRGERGAKGGRESEIERLMDYFESNRAQRRVARRWKVVELSGGRCPLASATFMRAASISALEPRESAVGRRSGTRGPVTRGGRALNQAGS